MNGKMYCIKLLNQQILHARDVDRPPCPGPECACTDLLAHAHMRRSWWLLIRATGVLIMTIKGRGYRRAETSYNILKEKTKKRKRNRRRPNTMAGE